MYHVWGEERHTGFWWGKSEGKRILGRPSLRRKDNTEMNLQEVGWSGSIWLSIGTSECGNEPSCSIICGEFLD
jgi:hypothetical protein